MKIKTLLPALTLLLLCTSTVSPATAQEDYRIVPLGAAAEGPRLITAEAIPAAPTNLQAFAISDDQINVTWQDNSSDETEFRLEIRTGGGTFQDVGTAIPANVETVQVHNLAPSTTYFFRVKARNGSGDSAYSNEDSATTLPQTTTCSPTDTAMCLNGGRFRVSAIFRTNTGLNGVARAVKLTDDSGYLWFFDDDNIEAVVKVLNGCGVNNRFWVFAGGLTNVRVELTVTDTLKGTSKTYLNPQNTAFQPIQDTSALATCP